jgi:hypothetical protein
VDGTGVGGVNPREGDVPRFIAVIAAVVGAVTPAAAHLPVVACSPGADGPTTVLVATNFIPKGTLGSVILKKRLYAPASIPCSQREEGAFGDPALLKGRIARHDIYPGQQLTRPSFSGVLPVSLTTPVRAGSYARLTVRVTPPTRCTIQVGSAAGSTPKTLGSKTGGRITWRWKVPSNTQSGRWPIVIRCGSSGTLRLTIRVLPR